jgi:hypothetical protein
MNRRFLTVIIFLLIALGFTTTSCGQSKSGNADLRVILIRHAEKPDDGDNLSCSGFNRSLKLPAVIKSKFGIPDYIYVPEPGTGKQTKNCRMFQTIVPLVVKYNLTVNTNYSVDESDKVVQSIKKNKGTVLVVWEHKELATIAALLGVKSNNLQWGPDDYDSIWIITRSHGQVTFTKDKEGIKPAETCPF